MTGATVESRLDDLDEVVAKNAENIRSIDQHIRDLEFSIHNQEAPPPQHDKLFKALAKAQEEIENAELDSSNPHYDSQFASLASVMNAVREPLAKNGLSLIQRPRLVRDEGGNVLGLLTTLAHKSGQYIEDYYEMYPPKQDPQGFGSCLTYMRRQSAMAIIGIAGANDDDAEGTLKGPDDYERISTAEADAILSKADELFGAKADEVVARMCDKLYGIERVKDIKAGEADLAMRRLENQAKRESKPAAEPAKEPDKDPEAKDDSEADGPRKKSGMKPQGDDK